MNFLVYDSYIFGTSITWYSLFVLTGAILAYLASKYFYKKDPLHEKYPDLMETIFVVAFPMGLVGARIWYIFSELDYYLADPIRMLKVWEGGLAVQGGVIGGILAGYFVLRFYHIQDKFLRMVDYIVPNILIGQSIGRWGNFMNQEVYGECIERSSVSWIPDFILNNMNGGRIYCSTGKVATPLFLYEALLTLMGFILISVVVRHFYKKKVDGQLGALYLVYYGLVRIIMEPLRNDEYIMKIFGNVSFSVLTSAIFIATGVITFILLEIFRKKMKKEEQNA